MENVVPRRIRPDIHSVITVTAATVALCVHTWCKVVTSGVGIIIGNPLPTHVEIYCRYNGARFYSISPKRYRIVRRSEERRVGKEWVSTCRFGGSPDH